MYLNFNLLPGFQNLFLDFINEFDNVKGLYPINFREVSSFTKKFEDIASVTRPFRSTLANAMRAKYEGMSVSEKTEKNLSLLDAPNTLFVITGQQLGILGGPMYTFYKTITAIKLAELMSGNFPNFHFIPLFWLEADDHDFEEVRTVTTINEGGTVQKISYGTAPEEDFRKLIGKLVFDETITTTIEQFLGSQRSSSFTPQLSELLHQCYKPGETFKESFSALFRQLFDKYGLIQFDPQMPEVKTILSPIFRHELEDYRKHSETLILTSASLDESYHAQVKVKPVNLFYEKDGNRYAIEPLDDDEFRLKRKKMHFRKEELLREAEHNPSVFSPNVILRPICQDFLFPTAFYIGGPGEISYFAQIFSLYPAFNIQRPILYPRASVTIVEKSIHNTLAKLNISPDAVLNHHTTIINSYLEEGMNQELHEALLTLNNNLSENLNSVKLEASKIDSQLEDAVEKARGKMESFISEMKRRILEAEKRKQEISVKQIQKVTEAFFPSGSLQEREISFFYFANKYGLSFLDTLFDEIEVEAFEHQLLFLG